MKKALLPVLLLATFLLIGAGCQRQQEVVSSYDDLASLAVDADFRITNIGDSATIGDPVTSVLPIYAYGCDVYGMGKDEPQRYSKIDFFISEDKKDSLVTLLGTTAPGSGGSGECDLLEDEKGFTSAPQIGNYNVWAVRYIDGQPDKRSANVMVSLVDAVDADKAIYTNTAYHYSFLYPKDLTVGSNSMGASEYEASNINVAEYFTVEANPVTMKEGTRIDPTGIRLKDFATIIYQNNKNETNPLIKIGRLQTTTVGESAAYSFSLEGMYSQDGRGKGGALSPGKHRFILTENNGTKFMISFPEGEKISENILATFRFIDDGVRTYRNTQYGFSFAYPSKRIDLKELGDTLGNGLFSVSFLSASSAPENDNNINGGLRVFLNVPNVAFGRYTLEDLLAGRDIAWETLVGYSSEYQWQCGDSTNFGGEKIRSCYV
ncbi:MAG: PsbP-related protein, partial [bacterium]|nr:PsbP-related protein [bacterium]